MKALFTALLSIFIFTSAVEAKIVIIKVNCSETDARIFSNGNFVGVGSAEITITYPGKVLVEAKKTGYITVETTIYYDNQHSKPDEKQAYVLTMVVDEDDKRGPFKPHL